MSILSSVETEAEKIWSEIEVFFNADVWPLIKETLILIEKGGAEALTGAATAAVGALESGVPFGQVVTAIEGTLTNSGIQVLEGAAATALQLVKNRITAAPAVVPPVVPAA